MAMQRVASAGDVPEGQVHVIELDGQEIALCHAEGDFYAIDNVCTHDGGPLDQGELDGCQIECPRHGARFDVRSGRALTLPAVTPVHRYAVELRDGEIYVDPDS